MLTLYILICFFIKRRNRRIVQSGGYQSITNREQLPINKRNAGFHRTVRLTGSDCSTYRFIEAGIFYFLSPKLHDQIFSDTVQRDFPEWQRYKFTSWDYTTGPKCKLSKNYAEEIQEYLDDDKPLTAGQTFGRYLEWIFGILNENMQTPIAYKVENVYTLSEFYNPLAKRFKDKLKLLNNQHKLIELFDEFETGTIFRNYSMHWKNESNQFTKEEIDAIFKRWLDIEQMIFCTSCKSFVHLEKMDGNEYMRCNCGAKNLKEPSLYTTK